MTKADIKIIENFRTVQFLSDQSLINNIYTSPMDFSGLYANHTMPFDCISIPELIKRTAIKSLTRKNDNSSLVKNDNWTIRVLDAITHLPRYYKIWKYKIRTSGISTTRPIETNETHFYTILEIQPEGQKELPSGTFNNAVAAYIHAQTAKKVKARIRKQKN